MQQSSRVLTLVAAFSMAALAATAEAQTSRKSTCEGVGAAPREPVGDREGHSIAVTQSSCHSSDGSNMTVTGIWEWDKGNAVMLTGNGMDRKADGMTVFEVTEGKNSLVMTDGKVTGFAGTSKGIYKAATGSMAALAGKSFTSTWRSIDGGQFIIETTIP